MFVLLRRLLHWQLRLQQWNPAEASLSEYPLALFLSPGMPISRLAFDLYTNPLATRLPTAVRHSNFLMSLEVTGSGGHHRTSFFCYSPIIEFAAARIPASLRLRPASITCP